MNDEYWNFDNRYNPDNRRVSFRLNLIIWTIIISIYNRLLLNIL